MKSSKRFFKELNISGSYENFKDFFYDNETIIYLSIIDIFINFKESKKKKLTLSVSTKINDMDWTTEFHFYRNESIVLKRDILPYFEKIENYETCQKINNLYVDLTS